MARPTPQFVMVIADHTKKEFSVEGPMTDDTRWTEAVDAAIKAGRKLNCSTAEISVEQAASEYQQQFGYKRVPAGSILGRS